MNIKLELLQNHINEIIKIIMEDITPDISKIADTTAIIILDKIKKIIADDSISDFGAIEEIVCIFKQNNIDCGSRHDF